VILPNWFYENFHRMAVWFSAAVTVVYLMLTAIQVWAGDYMQAIDFLVPAVLWGVIYMKDKAIAGLHDAMKMQRELYHGMLQRRDSGL
jgi:hypothetical protein